MQTSSFLKTLIHEEEASKSGVFQSIIVLITCTLGAGTQTLPMVMEYNGVWFGLLLIVLGGL